VSSCLVEPCHSDADDAERGISVNKTAEVIASVNRLTLDRCMLSSSVEIVSLPRFKNRIPDYSLPRHSIGEILMARRSGTMEAASVTASNIEQAAM
jgi:hypothetical protein